MARVARASGAGARLKEPGLMNLAGQLSPDDLLRELTRRDQRRQIDARLQAHPVQQVDQILSRQIAGCPWRVRTSPKPAHRRIERANTQLQPHEDVAERGTPRVVK